MTRRFRAIGVAIAAASAVVTLAAHPQNPPARGAQGQQPFRSGTRLVPVYATVTDNSGHFVRNLAREAFEVKDNGVRQELTQFTADSTPITVILMLDGSSSMLPAFDRVLEAANAFVIRLMPGDRAAIGSFADQVRVPRTFTSDRDALIGFLHDQFNIRMANMTALWEAVNAAVGSLATQTGRRVVVVASDGYDTSSRTPASVVEEAALRQDVLVYALSMWVNGPGGGVRPGRVLPSLASATGGGYHEVGLDDDLSAMFTDIALELHSQYVLGFTPAKLDGKKHDIDVSVKGANLKIRARKSYVASEK